jgi:hypothetical protein
VEEAVVALSRTPHRGSIAVGRERFAFVRQTFEFPHPARKPDADERGAWCNGALTINADEDGGFRPVIQ